jgi:hypothetical protein
MAHTAAWRPAAQVSTLGLPGLGVWCRVKASHSHDVPQKGGAWCACAGHRRAAKHGQCRGTPLPPEHDSGHGAAFFLVQKQREPLSSDAERPRNPVLLAR